MTLLIQSNQAQKMIKVLFVISNLNSQGPINQLFYLCKYLDKEKVKPYIVTTSQKSFERSMHQNFKDVGTEVLDLKLSKVQSILFAKFKIQKIIDKEGIQIIQSFGFRSDLISFTLKRVFKVTTVRNTLLYNWKMIWGLYLGTMFGRINLYVIRKFDSVIACSFSIRDYLTSLNLSTHVIVNSIDSSLIRQKPEKVEIFSLRESLNLPLKKSILLTISSKLKGKNIEFLLESIQKPGFENTFLIVAGYVEESILNNYSLSNVLFIGNVKNLQEFMLVADFFVSASLHEGMPNAVLEALAVGTPVLLSDIPPHIEILNSAEIEIGRQFKNNDFKSFLSSYKKLIEMDQILLSRNSTSLIQLKYSASKMAKQYQDYFLTIHNTMQKK